MAASKLEGVPTNLNDLAEALKNSFSGRGNILLGKISGRQRLLASMLTSECMKRSLSRTIILLMGCTGAGKSSTINHIFDFQSKVKSDVIAKTSDSRSETRTVQEYVYQTENVRLETSNITLGIVDTPGFGDTDGIRQDACNLKAISDFAHRHLKDKFPNLILVCFDATDTRYDGPCSNFSKLLKSIRELKLVDFDKPNVVIVLTKCCSLVIDVKAEIVEWKRKIQDMKIVINKIVSDALGISVPIIPIENHYERYKLRRPSLVSSEGESDFTELPDGQLQPYNLFKECSKLLLTNKDSFGHICFTTIFNEGKNLQYSLGNKVEPAVCGPVFVPLSKRSRLLSFLEGINQSPPVKNAFREKSEQYIKRQNLNGDDKREIEDLVDEINLCGFFNENDIKMNSVNIIEYHLADRRDSLSNIQSDFLQNFLKMEVIDQNLDVANQLQCGYHVFSDTLKHKIFNYPTEMKHGLMLPRNAAVANVSTTEHFAELVRNDIEFFTRRIQYLHGVNLKVRKNNFEFNSRPGFQIISDQTDKSSIERFLYYEKRFHQINLDDSSPKFTEEFIEAVNNLPDTYSPKDLPHYKEFFEIFGHYFVIEAYAGGSYERCSNTIRCIGGHPKFENLKHLPSNKEKLNWERSILNYPKLLTTTMKLKPIEEAVGRLNEKKGKALAEALTEVLHQEEENEDELSDLVSIADYWETVSDEPCLTRNEAVELEESVGVKVVDGIITALGVIIALPLVIVSLPFVIIGGVVKRFTKET